MRLGAHNCGKCSAPAPLYNKEEVLALAAIASLVLVFAVII